VSEPSARNRAPEEAPQPEPPSGATQQSDPPADAPQLEPPSSATQHSDPPADAPQPEPPSGAPGAAQPAHQPAAPGPLHRTAADAGMALSFLTLLPVPAAAHRAGDFGRAAGWFPLVGAGAGALAGGVRVAAEPLVGAGPATVLALATLVAVTGALHQDGLADCADGLGVRGDRERRLAVMRDSAIGTFGMLALLGWGLLLLTTLSPLTASGALLALIAAGALGRAAALVHATAAAPARRDGLGAGFAVPRTALALGALTAVAAALLAAGPLRGLLAIGAATLTAVTSVVWARRALGGRTGDTLGATIALTELAVVVALAASWH
jgi:adenosylcobinamide-GDP ribazoletransferase